MRWHPSEARRGQSAGRDSAEPVNEEQPELVLDVNGRQHRITVSPTTPLMYVLRNDLGLKGVRPGCSIGECGSCRVLIDGVSVPSCQTLLEQAVRTTIVTPEGLGTPEAPGPVQQAFLDEQAGQCGYCINGIITSVTAWLGQDGPLDAAGLRDALSENLCRCGTHVRILRAAARAAGLPPGQLATADDVVVEAGSPPCGDEPFEPPAAVVAEPQIARWIELRPDGRVDFHSGKVELGQGLRTALRQVVAAHLGLPLEQVHACPTATGRSPDEGQTSGSFSLEHGGGALAMAATALRRVLLARAAARLGRDAGELDLDEEGAVAPDGERIPYAELAATPVTELIEPTDLPRWSGGPLGDAACREDLGPKLTGSPAYLTDLDLPGMLHARAVLPPSYGAAPAGADLDGVRGMPGVVEVVRYGRLLLVIAEREEQAVGAQARLESGIDWQAADGMVEHDTERLLRDLPSVEHVRRRDDDVPGLLQSLAGHSATYVKPYQSHGPMTPSAALAVADRDRLRIWTHSQGVYPLRREIGAFLGLAEQNLVVQHVDGPGCYGLTCSDDAALLAAIAARAVPGRPVRLALSVQQEFAWDPYGPGMVGDLQAALDESGRIRAWKCDVISDSHSTRANGDGDRLGPAWLLDGIERPWVGLGEPSSRNSLPLYDIPAMDIASHGIRGPLRTGPLRSLGSFFNLFAVESFMDELAERAGQDPVAFRLGHLGDPRARRVLELAAERTGWQPHVGPSGRGLGVAFGRYKDTKGYAAVVAEVVVDGEQADFRVVRFHVVCDAGRVVNRDGLRNQLEGGVLQGLSRTLFEELHPAQGGVRERDWTAYRTLRFADVPRVDVTLVDRTDCPPLGAGEVATPLVPAAVANALDDALGVRLRRLPFSKQSIERRMLDMDEHEAERVLL